nr:methylaspartate mutase accessory protein GlmL [Sedimentibacter sp.]
MDAYLFVDFGSTFTKLTLVDIKKEEIVATEKSTTTVETDVITGYENALKKLIHKTKGNYNITKRLACSSAAGGLKIIAVGLVPELTAEAAKRAALGAGARVIKTYSFNLNCDEIKEIEKSDADIILLAGGTNGGDKSCITHNAKMIAEFCSDIPVVVAGNKSCIDEIKEIFNDKIEYYVTENVMPKINQINVDPVRETVRNIFINKITQAKGMRNVEKFISGILMPTPAAVLKSAEIMSIGTNEEDGIGDLAVIDIGGATTDVHSIAGGEPTQSSVVLCGLEEPYSKRTVEADLGMRYSAIALYEAAGKRIISKYLYSDGFNLEEEFLKRNKNTSFISNIQSELDFDEAMAKVCVDISMNRHAGRLKTVYTPMGVMYSQEGKDLMSLPFVIGTGGVIVNSDKPKNILEASLFTMEDPSSLKPRNPRYLLDKEYILSAMGLLAMIDKNKAIRILKKYIVEI